MPRRLNSSKGIRTLTWAPSSPRCHAEYERLLPWARAGGARMGDSRRENTHASALVRVGGVMGTARTIARPRILNAKRRFTKRK